MGKRNDGLDDLVQRTSETGLDTGPSDDWTDLVDTLPDHFCDIRIHVRAGVERQSELEGGFAFCHQSGGEPDFHAHPIWPKESAARCRGHSDRLEHDHLDDGGGLEALPMGRRCTGPVFCLGFVGDGAATFDHGDELGKNMIRPIFTGFFEIKIPHH